MDSFKSNTISKWKRQGIADINGNDSYLEIFEYFLQSTHCSCCKNGYRTNRDKCLKIIGSGFKFVCYNCFLE